MSIFSTAQTNAVTWDGWKVNVTTASNNSYELRFRWDSTATSTFLGPTAAYAPLDEESEVDPETFEQFLQRISVDNEYLNLQVQKQQELYGWLKSSEDEQREKMEELQKEFEERRKEELLERWGVSKLPPMTPELLDSIAKASRKFLEQCLTESELRMFEEEGKVRIQSGLEPEVFYIVKKDPLGKIEKYKDNKLIELLCYQSGWNELPQDDHIAMKVFNLKHNESEVLKVANHYGIADYQENYFINEENIVESNYL